ncbi:MAG: 8-oxo-dGTP diphosphatase [Tissierellales bacterium]|jgi:8-oxo-dGTP diphosphatase|nr:8-oxo-dGTP diphosphatase [Tissierellales bacterium]
MKLCTLCYLKKDDEVLLLHRNKKENDVHEGLWIGLGGKLEKGESPEDCVKREFKEESGLDIIAPKMRGVLTFPDFSKGEDYYVFLYTAEDYIGELIKDSPEGSLKWVEYESILDYPTWEGDKIFLKWLQEKKSFFSATFTYKDDKLENYDVVFHE